MFLSMLLLVEYNNNMYPCLICCQKGRCKASPGVPGRQGLVLIEHNNQNLQRFHAGNMPIDMMLEKIVELQ